MLNPPLLGFAVATRVMLGVGIGLLAAGCIPDGQRRKAGVALMAIGAATTIPIVLSVRRKRTDSTTAA